MGCTNNKLNYNPYIQDCTSTTIDFQDKSPDIIQGCIQGKWKVAYTFGGFAAIYHYPEKPEVYQFDNGLMSYYYDSVNKSSLRYNWLNVKNAASTAGNSYVLQPEPNSGFSIFIEKIKNDTLVFSDYNISDGLTHYLTRVK